ncbi:MAG: aminoacyl-histidine dipeptidase [Bacteroidales bacterium]|nr:aminoacyl-histidine dipeptidase [Bacteroidales bacterium]
MDAHTVLDHFKILTTIPRESGHEGPVTEYLCRWAESHGLACKTDAIGNVCISREASPGKEDVPTLVLQAHQDMVCEKNAGVQHDFAHDPIPYVIRDGWMIAPDTTLGADDGIGIAACLALLESDRPTGKLECVFTISEETGMDGAESMQEGFFTGKVLINLDSEDEGQLFIGCAGGENTEACFRYETEQIRDGYTRIELRVEGGQGGHSGDDINKERANAVRLLASFLKEELPFGMQIILLSGGGKSNAIARECRCVLAVPDYSATAARFQAYGDKVKARYAQTEPELCFAAKKNWYNEKVVAQKVAESLIEALTACPHGVVRMSPDIEGLVQTSTNLAAVRMRERGRIIISTSQRSSVETELDEVVQSVSDVFKKAGAQVRSFNRYPGWKPDLNSHVLALSVASYRRLFSQEPEVKAIHAGLECGLFLNKFPGLDMISFGPTLRGVHAPGERLELASLDKFVLLLDDLVCNYK